MAIPSKQARFKDYDSESRSTLCLLFDDYGHGNYLGQVYESGGAWVWEVDDTDFEDEDADDRGEGDTRRQAKAALRTYLKSVGILE